ncbi:MAG: toll/interleukin-1 receptor domain-containing protein [Burkholderiales bacterium]|nr:toll/interleukin-1 receptor domain-containing protein [Burkholderiales bacterium]
MSILLDTLDRAAQRPSRTGLAKSLNEALAKSQRSAFLSHSHLDRTRAKGLQTLLAEQGWELFIDWEHNTLDERPTRETAEWLQKSILACDWLLYLATPNSEGSRWCPWEVGYADGKKGADSIIIIATSDSSGTYGSEYLKLYRQISETDGGRGLALFEAASVQGGRFLRDISTARV